MEAAGLCTAEKVSILVLLAIMMALYWWAERENCLASLQRLVGSLSSDDEKEAALQKLDAEHLPLVRPLLGLALIGVFVSSVLVDCTFEISRSNHLQLYLDYTFYVFVLASLACTARTRVSANTLYSMSIISICFGMGHSLCSEPGSILLMTPIKVMQSLVAAVLLVDHIFGVLACGSALVDLLRLSQFDAPQGVLCGVVLTQIGSGVVSSIWNMLLRTYIMKEPFVDKGQEVNQFFDEHSAARRMLAVLCDAQVYLNQDLTIVSHCRGLAQLLMSTNSAKALEGRVFENFLAPRDRQRFQSFVENAVQCFLAEDVTHGLPLELVSGWKKRPSTPSSLQVHVMDSHGLLVAVELFHICVPGRGHERGHFIGITEAENSLSSHASFSDSGSANSMGSQIAAKFSGSNAFQEIFAFKPPEVAGSSDSSRRDLDLSGLTGVNEDSMSVASGSSESSVTSAHGLVGKMRACPEIKEGEIVVDAFCDRLSIKEAFFRFGKPSSNVDSPAPSILEWVWPSTREKFHAQMSHGVNLLFAPPGADLGRLEKKFEPIMFQLPFKNKNSYALVANQVELAFADRSQEGDEQQSQQSNTEDGQEDVLVKLKLSQFMVKRLSPSKPQKIRELEERAKARADMVRTNSMVSGSSRSQGRDSEVHPRQFMPKGSKPPSASDRSETLEPIQELTNRRRRREASG